MTDQWWVVDRHGKRAQWCGTRELAERQAAFFSRIRPEQAPFIPTLLPTEHLTELPKRTETWRKARRSKGR